MDIRQLIMGQKDSRGMIGKLARGANIYNGTSNAAHKGGGQQFGRPPKKQKNTPGLTTPTPSPQTVPMAAIKRRMTRGTRGY